jgi:hypothetical protein
MVVLQDNLISFYSLIPSPDKSFVIRINEEKLTFFFKSQHSLFQLENWSLSMARLLKLLMFHIKFLRNPVSSVDSDSVGLKGI